MRSPILSLALSVLGLLSVGCGPDFDPPSELHSLRILGVQKDVPYAQPGQTVNLRMLWTDAALNRPRPVKIAWSAPCFDPDGDLYYACFNKSGVFTDAQGKFDPTILTLDSDTMHFDMPQDIITGGDSGVPRRNPPTDPRNPEYGIAYVFFAICAGEFTFIPPTGDTTFPVGCQDENGKLLGADDFVAGYSGIYSFSGFSNNNPVVTGFNFNGKDFTPDPANADLTAPSCLNETCTSGSNAPADIDFDCEQAPERCIPTCADDGDSSCPGYNLNPLIDKNDPANQDQDDVSAKLLGRQVGEQMWIDYYTEAGSFKSPVRLLNDATAGWNDNFGTQLYAPKAAGPFRLWALVHDNRGGVAWSGITIKAQ